MSTSRTETDPMVHRRRLRNELKRERESAGLTQRDVAAAMDWSLSKLIRIEAGAVGVTTNDLRVLLGHYGINEAERIEAMIAMAKIARAPSRWQRYKEVVAPELLDFLAYESAAATIRNFEPLFVPGLLQTEDYARAALSIVFDVERTASERERLVELRLERQDILGQSEETNLRFVIDEAAIHRVPGNAGLMRRQLRHLLETMGRPNVRITVIPYTFGFYPLLQIPHVLFGFTDPADEDILYIENPRGDLFVREAVSGDAGSATPATYLANFDQLEEALDPNATPQIIEAAIAALA